MRESEYRRAMAGLLEHADDLGVPVRFFSRRTMDGHVRGMAGGFAPRGPGHSMIALRRGGPRVTTVYVLAHELGHAAEWLSLSHRRAVLHSNVTAVLAWHLERELRVPESIITFMCDRERVACDTADETLAELEIDVPAPRRARYRRQCVKNFERVMRRSGRR